MALPHQVKLVVTYDGTVSSSDSNSDSKSSSGSGKDFQYTVVSGDTLWALAKKYYGSGTKYTVIYNANVSTIEAVAKSRGKSNSNNGYWIYPGTELTIPGVTSSQTSSKNNKDKNKASDTGNTALGSKIAKQAESFTYTDVASGASDSVSITISDIEKEWMGKWMPQKGASLGAKLKLTNWNEEDRVDTFKCGNFILDDISFSGRPLSCVLGGVSVPAMNDFKSLPKTKTWEKTTIKEIASEIARNAGVSLHYDAGAIQIAEIEQNRQTDSAFLYSLCEKYGLAMKVYNKKIVIFDIVAYEAKKPVLTIKEKDMLSGWSYNTTIEGTYTGVDLNYTDPDSDETINVTIGKSGRMYELNTQASSRYDAELQAAAKVNAANREIETMTVPIRANINIVASHCVQITGLGKINGKYYVDKIKHSVGTGYKMQLSLHKVQTPIKLTRPEV